MAHRRSGGHGLWLLRTRLVRRLALLHRTRRRRVPAREKARASLTRVRLHPAPRRLEACKLHSLLARNGAAPESSDFGAVSSRARRACEQLIANSRRCLRTEQREEHYSVIRIRDEAATTSPPDPSARSSWSSGRRVPAAHRAQP